MSLELIAPATVVKAQTAVTIYCAGFKMMTPKGMALTGHSVVLYFEAYDASGNLVAAAPHKTTLAALKAAYPAKFADALSALKAMSYAEGQKKYGDGMVI